MSSQIPPRTFCSSFRSSAMQPVHRPGRQPTGQTEKRQAIHHHHLSSDLTEHKNETRSGGSRQNSSSSRCRHHMILFPGGRSQARRTLVQPHKLSDSHSPSPHADPASPSSLPALIIPCIAPFLISITPPCLALSFFYSRDSFQST
jgi:hypothetical protein